MSSNPPTQSVFSAGNLVSAAEFQNVIDGVNWLVGAPRSGQPRRPLFYLNQTVAQSVANTTETAIAFDSESYDTDAGHSTSTNTSRYTCQTSGLWLLMGTVALAANATGSRKATFRVNGSAFYWIVQVNTDTTSGFQTAVNTVGLVPLTAGDYVEVTTYQNSGGSLNTDVTTATGGSRFAGLMMSVF